MRRLERVGWAVVAFVLCALAIPWFLWGDDRIVASLPLWLWWHIAWMGLASIVFWLFAQRAWGIGIETEQTNGDSSDRRRPESSSRSSSGGERP